MFELVESTTMTVRPNRTMLPPIWVAACDEPEAQERRVPEDREGALRLGAAVAVVASRHARGVRRRGPASSAAVSAGSPRSTNATSRRSSGRRSRRTWRPQVWQRRPMSAPSRSTSHVSPPHGWARRSRTTSPRNSVRTGRVGHRRVRVSKPRMTVGRDERPVGRRQLEPLDRRDRDDDVRLRRGQLGDDPAGPGQRARQLVRRADRHRARTGRRAAARRPSTRAGRTRTTTPGTSRTPPIAIASAPALRSSLMRSSTPLPSIGAADRDRDARARRPGRGPRRRGRGPGRRAISSTETRRAAGSRSSVASSRSSVATSRRSWSLRALRLATRTVRSCDDSCGEPGLAGLARSWMTTSRPSTKATAAIVSWLRRAMHRQPPGLAPGAGADGGRRRRSAANSAG